MQVSCRIKYCNYIEEKLFLSSPSSFFLFSSSGKERKNLFQIKKKLHWRISYFFFISTRKFFWGSLKRKKEGRRAILGKISFPFHSVFSFSKWKLNYEPLKWFKRREKNFHLSSTLSSAILFCSTMTTTSKSKMMKNKHWML